ncbi:uncharacterized protein DUF4374 [Chitinophaga skermanii]|uniref:Uncharacterized protein DUF4374 n=1 Tax=Chitinophaga skermanii TaxID=331697 RepID=A0A327QWM2_9BACT|nr:DUF4374 domain-containing protein [Chitinophaga skermanii]RAJ08288.1 uncharacterized protein DUF4374 [Chitinophaga skermanii]
MKLNRFFQHIIIAPAVFCAVLLAGCEKEPKRFTEEEGSRDKKYGALMMLGSWPNTAYYLVEVPSLKEGSVGLNGKGVNVTTICNDQGFIQRDGYYYYLNSNTGRLGKYHINNDKLITDKEVPFPQMASISSHVWVNAETLILIGTNGTSDKVLYSEVKVTDLSVSNGELNISLPAEKEYLAIAPGFVEYRDGKIFMGYSYTAKWPALPYPKVLVSVIDYPSMNISATLEDSRSWVPGAPTRYTPYSFTDDRNDIYFTTVPEAGFDYDGGSAIYRIKNGTAEIDPNYFFDFSAALKGHTCQAMWYIGNGEAIARVRIPSDRSRPDFYYYWESYFVIFNVRKGEIVRKLDLPTDIGEVYVNAVVVEDNKAYIMLNSPDKKGHMYEYDPMTGNLTQGLAFDQGYEYLLRIDKW